jgi:hypothetical protein
MAANAMGTVNPNAYGAPLSFDMSGMGADQISQMYQQAFDMLNSSRSQMGKDSMDLPTVQMPDPFTATPEQWAAWNNGKDARSRGIGTTIDQAMSQLQLDYQGWLNKRMSSGGFGLTGSTVSY